MKKKTLRLKKITVIIFTLFSVIALNCQTVQKELKKEKKVEKISDFMRGLYIPNRKGRSLSYIKKVITRGKPLGVNMVVIDVHKYLRTKFRVNPEVIAYLKKEDIYTAARVVCFQYGLKRLPVKEKYMKKLNNLLVSSAKIGFDEIQLDYIRFEDGGLPYSLKRKYKFIEELLIHIRKLTAPYNVKLSVDIFGRIVYNRNDPIGQKLEIFAKYVSVIYPMLYPSHFTGDKYRMSHPGKTVKEATLKGLKRLKGMGVALQPFIQAFPYNIQWARVKLAKYVELQIRSAEDTEARGWVAWNPRGNYNCVIEALGNIREQNKTESVTRK